MLKRNFELFSNKAYTLKYLNNKVQKSKVLDMFIFSVSEFKNSPTQVIKEIKSCFNRDVIIRSSASSEDQKTTNAGHFKSISNVKLTVEALTNAINEVIFFYQNDFLDESEIIFVQPMIKDVKLCGVAFSREPQLGSPYWVINYDDSGSTDSVTSGLCNKHIYVSRDVKVNKSAVEENIGKLITAFREVEEICGNDSLDIEFAIVDEGTESIVIILQVRKLNCKKSSIDDNEIFSIKNFWRDIYSNMDEYLSDMAFWNPAEMIGDNPHNLAYSLYSFLVTDNAWNDGIKSIGYSDTAEKLMVRIGNRPYIRLDIAFLSLLPNDLNKQLKDKLVTYYKHILASNPKLHDKIEFQVVFSCYDFCTDSKLEKLLGYGFTRKEITQIKSSLMQLTFSAIKEQDRLLIEDKAKLQQLGDILKKAKESSNSELEEIVLNVKNVLFAIRDYGVVSFARRARLAFIAESLCRSLVESEMISESDMLLFRKSIKTVLSDFLNDIKKFSNDVITKESFLEKYGHLRSGTYDICSPSYKDSHDEMMFKSNHSMVERGDEVRPTDLTQIDFDISKFTDLDVITFIRESIIYREHFKFEFTKAVSFVLDSLSKLQSLIKCDLYDISFVDIKCLIELEPSISHKKFVTNIKDSINKSKLYYDRNSALQLPSVLISPENFNIINSSESEPNFVTNENVNAVVTYIRNITDHVDVSDKIVLIENADPGFDWIFAKDILGLITKYGGAASHMAIRCMELGIPAAIGCGEVMFESLRSAHSVQLDCGNKKVRALV